MRLPCTLRESLSGVQIEHRSTPGPLRNPGRHRQRIVGLVLDHRPHRDAERGQRRFQQPELRQQLGIDAGAGLVARPEIVAERLDDVVRRDPDVCARRD